MVARSVPRCHLDQFLQQENKFIGGFESLASIILTYQITQKNICSWTAEQVDDKYQYSSENEDLKVHGWISLNPASPIGFWQITPSSEFRSGGPVKQNLTSHVGPYALAVSESISFFTSILKY